MNLRRSVLKDLAKLAAFARGYKNTFLGSTLAFLTLLLSSSLSDVTKNLNPFSNTTVWIAIVFFVSSLCLTFISTEWAGHRIEHHYIRFRFTSPKIGVFRTDDESDADFREIKHGCEFAPRSWVEGLHTHTISAQTVIYRESLKDFDVLVNPYGERYLESDVSNMRTLKEIKEFVKDGGLFVSMGGLAFFYMYNPRNKIEGLTGPMFEYYIGGSYDIENQGLFGHSKPSLVLEPRTYPDATSLVDSWVFRNLGLRTTLQRDKTTRMVQPAYKEFANLLESDATVQEYRAVERCESSDNELIPIFEAQYQYAPTERTHQCYPISALHHGLGYFLICGIVVNDEGHKNLIQKTIKRICTILAERGRLEFA